VQSADTARSRATGSPRRRSLSKACLNAKPRTQSGYQSYLLFVIQSRATRRQHSSSENAGGAWSEWLGAALHAGVAQCIQISSLTPMHLPPQVFASRSSAFLAAPGPLRRSAVAAAVSLGDGFIELSDH